MGLKINISYDTSVTALSTTNPTLYNEFTTAVQTAVNYFQSLVTNKITVNIAFGWGEVGGGAITPGASGESISREYTGLSYSNIQSLLTSAYTAPGASAVQRAAAATLTTTDPTNGASFNLNTAEAKALGMAGVSPNDPALDGSVGLDSSSATTWAWVGQSYTNSSEDAVATIEHEISEVLGRSATGGAGGTYNPLDLFRYTAANGLASDSIGAVAGVRDQPFVAGYNANAPSYFSYNGTTVTQLFETPTDVTTLGTDVADWAGYAGVGGNTPVYDAFGDSPTGAPSPVSTTDLQVLNVLGYSLAPTCFFAGTRIATANGEVRVEDITPGTLLMTYAGEILPVRWLGRSEVSMRFADPLRVLPIRIRAGALGENMPRRDLLVSPCHAMFVEGVLIQAGALVNGVTIIQERDVPETFTYYHVELATHELLVAEGAPSESFVDNVDRMAFSNWAEHEGIVETAPITEMSYPRAKSRRQVPQHISRMMEGRAMVHGWVEAAA